MKKNLLVGFAAVLFSFGCVQALSAQASGRVIRLHPADGELICIHEYDAAVAEGFVKNETPDRAIRARITIEITKRVTFDKWETVQVTEEIKLIDVGGSANLTATCPKELPKNIYNAKVWLQWQYVYEDIKTGRWSTLAHPTPPSHSTDGNTDLNKNTFHLFVITPCDSDPPSDGIKNDQ